MSPQPLLGPDGRCLVVAVDHPLYSWPCHGLEDRGRVLRQIEAAGGHGRNVWGGGDPAAAVSALRAVVHPQPMRAVEDA